MGNLYRFVEPVLLFLVRRRGRAYGYELAGELREYSLTDSEIEVAAVYRTLRQLEQNDCLTSEWEVQDSGPARRVYALTARGERHLEEWLAVLGHLSDAMARLVREAKPLAARDRETSRGVKPGVSAGRAR